MHIAAEFKASPPHGINNDVRSSQFVGMDPSQFSAILYGVNISRGSNTSALAAAMFLLYDFVLCFNMEVKHIWQAKWTVVKILYLISRYYGIAHCLTYAVIISRTNLSPNFCSNFAWWSALTGNNLFTTIVNILLSLRILALYHKSIKILIFLIFLLVAEFTGEMWASIRSVTFVSQHPITLPPGIPITGCLWEPPPDRIQNLAGWVPCLTVEFCFFLMTVWKFVETQVLDNVDGRTSMSLRRLRSSRQFSPLITGFAKDGSLFFFAVFCVLLLNTVLSMSDYTIWFLPWVPAIHSFASTRLVLSLKDRASGKIDIHSSDGTFVDTFRPRPRTYHVDRGTLNSAVDLSIGIDLREMH